MSFKQVIKQVIRPANREVRILVGLLLAILFCIQCTRTDAINSNNHIGEGNGERSEELEKLAMKDHVALLEFCLKHVKASYGSYTCTLFKRECIRGRLYPEQEINVKFRANPFSVAMAWTEKTAPLADRTLYVQGKYNNNMLVRPKGWLAQKVAGNPAIRDPECEEVMKSTLRPITQFGFEKSLQSLIDVYKDAREHNCCKEEFGGYKTIYGRQAIVLIRYLPPERDYPAHKTETYIDVEYLIPIGIVGYGWNDDKELLCSYIYKDLVMNADVTDSDFAPSANGIKDP